MLHEPTNGMARRKDPLPLAVLEFESPSAAIIASPVPPFARVTNLMVFLLVVSMLLASGLIRVDKIVSATGKLVGEAPNIVIQSYDKTIVESINVRKGDIVRKGQVLARLNPTFTAADLTAMKDQVDLLRAKAARLEGATSGTDYIPDPDNPLADLQGSIFRQQTSEYYSSLQTYDQMIGQLQTQIATANAQAEFSRNRLGVAVNVESMHQSLQDRGHGSKLRTLMAQDERLEIAASLTQAESNSVEASRRIAALKAERETFIQRWNGQNSLELADVRGKLVQAEQEYEKAKLHNELVVLIAPRDAIVLAVGKISVGSVVSSDDKLIELVPLDAQLSVEAYVSGVHSGHIRPGDMAQIKFDTLPFLQYGGARGAVRAISADSFSPEATPAQGGSTLPNRPRTLYYRADISIDEVLLHQTPPGFQLVPGMPLTVEVKVGTRSVLGYFVSKILPVAQNSLREP
jgi:HlyD family secretion protein